MLRRQKSLFEQGTTNLKKRADRVSIDGGRGNG